MRTTLLALGLLFISFSLAPFRALANVQTSQCVQPSPSRNPVFMMTRVWGRRDTPITSANARPIVAYIGRDGGAIDWMFDGVIITQDGLDFNSEANPASPTPRDLDDYERFLFDAGQLNTLANVVRDLRTELGDPTYRLKVYLAATHAIPVPLATIPIPFGPPLVIWDERRSDVVANTQALISRFNGLFNSSGGRDELELVGLFWQFAESTGTGTDPEDVFQVKEMQRLSAFLHGQCLELIWVPFFSAKFVGNWRSYGFDRVALQPNYAFCCPKEGWGPGAERFLETDDKVRTFGLAGEEFEFGLPRNPNVMQFRSPELMTADRYLLAADQYSWSNNPWTVFYYSAPIVKYLDDLMVDRCAFRDIYERLYRFVAAKPRSSRLPRRLLHASRDTFTEAAAPTRPHGNEQQLMVGTDNTGNRFHAFIQFDIPRDITSSLLISARLKLTVKDFIPGGALNDLEIRAVNYSTSHSTFPEDLTWNGEPNVPLGNIVNNHRILRGTSTNHSIDVTDQVRGALALGNNSVSFVIRRSTETSENRQASFYSREFVRNRVVEIVPTPDWNPGLELIIGFPIEARPVGTMYFGPPW